MSGDYKLQALLELREHALAEAERTLSLALADLSKCLAAQQGLDTVVLHLLEKLRGHKQEVGMAGMAAHFQAHARFQERLQTELADAERVARAHRMGPLAQAELQLEHAQLAHVQAKQDLKLISRHREASQRQADRQDERLAEEEVDNWLRARRS